jgi:hypothetical protein
MAVIVIGGQTRNIGKTAVVCALISATPQRRWTAIKITQHAHHLTPPDYESGYLPDPTVAIREEHDPATGADSSRYLAAGAERSFLVHVCPGRFAEAMPRIHALIESAPNVILESNSVLGFLKPDLYASILDPQSDPQSADFKASALRYLDRADAVLLTGEMAERPAWSGETPKLIDGIPLFAIGHDFSATGFVAFLTEKLRKVSK